MRQYHLLLAAFACLLPSGAAAVEPAGERPPVFFRAVFDGNLEAGVAGQPVAPVRATGVAFEERERSRAVIVGDGDSVAWPLPEDFPGESGALELIFRPDFPQEPGEERRTVLALRGEGESGPRLTVSFEPVGPRWELALDGRVLGQLWRGAAKQGEWHHFLLTWDNAARPRPVASFYHNGSGGNLLNYVPPASAPAVLELGGPGRAGISVDGIAVYTRALSRSQAEFLAGFRDDPDRRFAALPGRLADDDRAEAARLAERRALLDRLAGRVGRLIHLRGEPPQDFSFPEGIAATGIRPEEIGEIDLGRFSVIYFPEGTAYQLSREQGEIIAEYVGNGGGYVGSCAGANFAGGARLLDFGRHTFLGAALFPIRLEPHAVTEGYGSSVVMHHGNGPIMTPRSGCRAIGFYPVPGDPDRVYGAILVGMRGRGRVVLFGPHPLGGDITAAGKSVRLSAEDLGTDRMFVNALLYAAGLLGEDEPAAATAPPAE